ncbi:hypothetical protein LTR50_005340 [Elasticomyces elasticus]|nr:hypothetical protein LTR50_005340 [Elasticomyces elasticus]
MAAQKVCLITAGTAGLGAQIARAFAPDYRVIVNYANNASRASSLVKELEAIPSTSSSAESPRFLSIQADVGDRAALQNLIAEAVNAMGRLDVVISNHGWTRITNFMNLDEGMVEDDWDKCFLYNVKSHVWLMHAVRPELEKTEGCFISTASLAGVKPSGSSLPYAVTKAAQIHLVKALANICSPKIRVNSVSPGLLLTDWGMQFPEGKREAARENSKLKRLATVEDVADQVRTLALSRSVTGQNLSIDGGASL